MSDPSTNPEERYAAIVKALVGEPGVTHAADGPRVTKGFGAAALRVNSKIFAMLVKGRLVVKLPRERVEALIAAGEGERFESGQGRLMKEWVSLDPGSEQGWLALAREAMGFVGSKR